MGNNRMYFRNNSMWIQSNASSVLSLYGSGGRYVGIGIQKPQPTIINSDNDIIIDFGDGKAHSLKKLIEIVKALEFLHEEDIDIYKIADSLSLKKEEDNDGRE